MAIAEEQNRAVALRPLTPADCERVVGWIESEDAMYQWSGPASFTWPLDVEQLLRDLHGGSDSQFLLAATDGCGELIGHARLAVSRHHRLGWIGRIVIAPAHRGRGLAGAMMRELVAYGFDLLGLHRLQLGVYTFNAAAIAAYRAAGFVVEGELRDSTRSSTGYWNGFVMGMLESDRAGGTAPAPAGGGTAIRGARFADRHRIAALLTQLGYPHDASQAGERLTTWMGDRQGTVLVAEVGGSVAGVIAVHAIPYFERAGAFARIVALAVDRELRRAGIGRRLVHAAHQWAGARGCVDAEVTSRLVREDAHGFYAALGYEDQGARSGRLKRTLDQSTR